MLVAGKNFQSVKVWAILCAFFTILTGFLTYNALAKNEIDASVYRILRPFGTGTGFKVAEPGIIVTNYHVVEGVRSARVAYFDNEQDRPEFINANLVWFNSDKDLAILEAEQPLPGEALELADIGEEQLTKTDDVTAVGYPGVADRAASYLEQGLLDKISKSKIGLDATFSSGTIQRLVPSLQRLVIQHSANVNPGNSGGPLLDTCDRVIGVNTLSAKSTINLKDFADALVNSGRVSVDDPGALEFAVHISEIVRDLRSEGHDISTTPGKCWGSVDFYERITVSASFLATLASLALCLVAVRNDNIDQYHQNDGIEQPNFTMVSGHDENPHLKQLSNNVSFDLTSSDQVLGRTSNEAGIVIPDSSISRSHARIFTSNGNSSIEDLGSTNGTFVDGRRLKPHSPNSLINGQAVRLGSVEFKFVHPSANNIVDGNYETWMLSGFDQAGNTIQHTLHGKNRAIREGEINEICRIGRSNVCDVTINDKSISREHAAIGINSAGQLAVLDLNSSNGTMIDGYQIGNMPMPIRKSQQIIIGNIELYISK